eukprot:gnl/TRDRNA2_/TRDRNA2_178367_c0_seq1.p1 gnl/TRDRNA2_/TRDRNA2_178367_c0~~gnl/TRDRNA2_/TRDRNA2_178367_c0_seq1.p1  ORF type:complete len:688 (-),score=76.28 gnl/TRDRNA2_/TRDRNA2_178367_c0_seq1:648-2510(-)
MDLDNTTASKEMPALSQSLRTYYGQRTFDQLVFSVVRIPVVASEFDWLEPWNKPHHEEKMGSGFVVEIRDGNDPIIITNAHVVKDGHMVHMQLPVLGETRFEAFVPLICPNFDLAVVKFKEPNKVLKAMQDKGIVLRALPLEKSPIEVGAEVFAFGFPLGTNSPKISRGVIAGVENIDGNLVYQTTAPISGGNSGGPLLTHRLTVVGVNFASAGSFRAQNNNYVVPAFRILQILYQYDKLLAKKMLSQRWIAESDSYMSPKPGWNPDTGASDPYKSDSSVALAPLAEAAVPTERPLLATESTVNTADRTSRLHHTLRIAPVGVTSVPTEAPLYTASGGCGRGIYLAQVLNQSMFKFAEPAVQAGSFLEEVNGIGIDSFGMGRHPTYLKNPISFNNLLSLQNTLDDPVTLTTCKDGTVTRHTASLVWHPEYAGGIPSVYEPEFEPELHDYEFFAGLCVMQMTANHVKSIVNDLFGDLFDDEMPTAGGVGSPRMRLPEDKSEKRLVVTYVDKGSYTKTVMSRGMIIDSLNGMKVTTLAEFRKHFVPSHATSESSWTGGGNCSLPRDAVWSLINNDEVPLAVYFQEELSRQLAKARLAHGSHLLTAAVRAAVGCLDESLAQTA